MSTHPAICKHILNLPEIGRGYASEMQNCTFNCPHVQSGSIPVEVMRSGAGFYLGTNHPEGGPQCRMTQYGDENYMKGLLEGSLKVVEE